MDDFYYTACPRRVQGLRLCEKMPEKGRATQDIPKNKTAGLAPGGFVFCSVRV